MTKPELEYEAHRYCVMLSNNWTRVTSILRIARIKALYSACWQPEIRVVVDDVEESKLDSPMGFDRAASS